MTTTTAPPTPPAPNPTRLLRDTGVLTSRALRHQLRHVDGLILGAVIPVVLLLLFVYVFGGAIAGRDDYVQYVVPGVIVLAAGFSAAQVALAVNDDLGSGTVDRLRSMSTPISAMLVGHVLANVVRNLASTVLVVALALVIGFQPEAGVVAWIGVGATAAAFMVAVAAVSVVAGVAARSADGASGFSFFVLFLPYLSSAFVPPETLPTALRGIAEHQPVTPVIETMRGLLLDQPIGSAGWQAAAWCSGIVAVSVPVATWLYRQRTSPR